MNHKEEALRAVIDELKYENRKVEYSSALERLQRKVKDMEERLNKLENKL